MYGPDAAQFESSTIEGEISNPNSKKKPQMRYDPSEPMTKEAAAVWRREQRRKRNRDSDTDNKGCNVPKGIKVELDQEHYVLRNIEAKKAKNLNEISRPAKSESLPHNLCVLQILCQVPVM